MEATREIYRNIGHGVVIPMYLLTFAAFGILAWGFRKRLPVWRQGKPLDRFDRYDERVKRLVSTELQLNPKLARLSPVGYIFAHLFTSYTDDSIRNLTISSQKTGVRIQNKPSGS